MADDIELVMVTMRFHATEATAERLLAVLSKYVVLTRHEPGCRNVDLCSSALEPYRLVVVQKWESADAQRAHFDSDVMVEMARSCDGLLTEKPEIDLLETISAHDLA